MRKLSIIKYAIFFCTFFSVIGHVSGAGFERHTWEYYLEKGSVQYRGKMFEYAIHSFQRCLDINPQCYQAANYLGEIYSMKEDGFRALSYYRRSLAVNDRQPDVHMAAGVLCERFGDAEEAFSHFKRLVQIDPSHVKGNAALVRFYLARGDRAAADHHFQASYRQSKLVSGGLLDRAREARDAGLHREAAALYRRAIDEAPLLIEAYLGLFELCRSSNDYAPAAEALERLAFVKPDFEKAYLLLGYFYFTQKLPGSRKRRIDQAISSLKKAVGLNPDNFEAFYSLSEIYSALKKDPEAKEWEEKGRAAEERTGVNKGR